MKFLIIFVAVVIFAFVEAGSPEQWADETYDFVKNFKGDKKSFTAALTLRMMKEAPKAKKMPKEDVIKGIELLCSKFTGNEVITADEIKAFFEDMMKKFPTGR